MSNLHPDLPNDQLHVAKGFSTASNGQKLWRGEKGEQVFDNSVIYPQALSLVSSYSAPPTENYLDIYLLDGTANHADWDGIGLDSWARYDGTIWYGITPNEGDLCYNKSENEYDIYNGTSWQSWSQGSVINKYIALLTQTSTNAPTVHATLVNTTGETPIIAYDGVGIYSIGFTSVFTSDTKVRITISCSYNGTVSAVLSGSNTITIQTANLAGAAANGILLRSAIIIEEYR